MDIPSLPPLPPLSSMYTSTSQSFINITEPHKNSQKFSPHDEHVDKETTLKPFFPPGSLFSDPRVFPKVTDNSNSVQHMPTPSIYFHHDSVGTLPEQTNASNHSHCEMPLAVKLEDYGSDTQQDATMYESQGSYGISPKDENAADEKRKNYKRNCANVIVKYLSPYYKSGEIKSKVNLISFLMLLSKLSGSQSNKNTAANLDN